LDRLILEKCSFGNAFYLIRFRYSVVDCGDHLLPLVSPAYSSAAVIPFGYCHSVLLLPVLLLPFLLLFPTVCCRCLPLQSAATCYPPPLSAACCLPQLL
jgi:hypothetical protein